MTDVTASAALHLTPEDYHVIGPEDFNAPGLSARESIGPFTSIAAFGPLLTVHDSRFDAGTGIGHHPHQRMERLFYILEGTVDHDDVLNHITGHMGTGDLGILTEGSRGMIHSEWNHSDRAARAYIFVYPTDPTPPTASFAAVRDADAPRHHPAPGVTTKAVVARDDDVLRGDLRELGDTSIDHGAAFDLDVGADEGLLMFVVGGTLQPEVDGATGHGAGPDDTILLPPQSDARTVRLRATGATRVIHAVVGPGYGLRRG